MLTLREQWAKSTAGELPQRPAVRRRRPCTARFSQDPSGPPCGMRPQPFGAVFSRNDFELCPAVLFSDEESFPPAGFPRLTGRPCVGKQRTPFLCFSLSLHTTT